MLMTIPWWLMSALTALLAGAAFAVRVWLKNFIEGQVKVGFERQSEAIRSEIRQSEERLKSDLRTREAELHSLREGVLSGRASRMALIDKRRLEAVERVWVGATKLMRMKGPAMTLSILKFDEVARRVSTDPKLREMIQLMTETFGGKGFEERMSELNADEERPFVSDLAWALYSAYSTIVIGSWAIMKMLSAGVEDPEKLIKRDHAGNLLKSVLPEYAAYIDEHREAAHYYLLEKLETKILLELRQSLEGFQVDADNIERSKEIMAQVSKAKADLAEFGGSVPADAGFTAERK